MNIYELKPYISLGDLIFGMKRRKIRKICGDYKSYPTGFPVENRYMDDFDNVQCYYTHRKKLEAVSINPDSIIEYNNVKIEISKDAKLVIEKLNSIVDDLKYLHSNESYYSKKLGIFVFCPEDIIENIMIFSEHYYDEENEYLMKNYGTTVFED